MSLFRNVRTSSDLRVQCVPGLKRPGRGPNHFPRCSSGIIALSQCCTLWDLMIWCLFKARGRFYLFLYFWILQLYYYNYDDRPSPFAVRHPCFIFGCPRCYLGNDTVCDRILLWGQRCKLKSLPLSFTSFLVRHSATVPLPNGVRSEVVTVLMRMHSDSVRRLAQHLSTVLGVRLDKCRLCGELVECC